MFDTTGPVPDGTMPEVQRMRIGVFICHCGGNISDVVDVKRVAEEASRMPDVAWLIAGVAYAPVLAGAVLAGAGRPEAAR